jgi:hypothetical protein
MSNAVCGIKSLPVAKAGRKTYLRRSEIWEGEKKCRTNLIIKIKMSSICLWREIWRQNRVGCQRRVEANDVMINFVIS